MKKTLFAAIAVPFVIAIPVVAHADPGGPPSIFTPQQECHSTQVMVSYVHKMRPDAKTPEQIVDAYSDLLVKQGLRPVEDKPYFLQFTKDHMKSCNIH